MGHSSYWISVANVRSVQLRLTGTQSFDASDLLHMRKFFTAAAFASEKLNAQYVCAIFKTNNHRNFGSHLSQLVRHQNPKDIRNGPQSVTDHFKWTIRSDGWSSP